MGLIDYETRSAAAPMNSRSRPRPSRDVSEFEGEIQQLYVRMMDEPIPSRLIGILRAGLAGAKS